MFCVSLSCVELVFARVDAVRCYVWAYLAGFVVLGACMCLKMQSERQNSANRQLSNPVGRQEMFFLGV